MTKKYEVVLSKKCAKDLKLIPKYVRGAIEELFETLEINPRPQGYLKLKGYDDLYRIRLGDYRVIYSIEDCKLLVLVVEIGDRKDVYR